MSSAAIKFGGYQRPTSILNQAAGLFGETLQARLGDGIVDFLLDPDVAEMGHHTKQLMPLIDDGTYDIGYINTSYFANSIPELGVLEIPFAIKSRERIRAALDGILGDRLTRAIESAGAYKVLGYWDNGFRYFSNSVRPIRTPEDCQGIRMRTHSSEVYAETFSLLGFEPVAVHISGLLDAIDSGAIDAQENPLTNLYNFGIHKHHRYITLSGHFWGACAFLCNAERYSSWSTDVQEAVIAAAAVATTAQWEMAATEDERVRAILDPNETEIIELAAEEHAAFENATRPLIERQRTKLGADLCDMIA